MMMNLFTPFDPSTSMNFSLNWLSSIYILLFLPNMYWIIPSRWMMLYFLLLNLLNKEFKILMNKKLNYLNILIFICLFFFIMLNNFLSLFSYIFTSSSHLLMSLTYSLSLWISFMLFGWILNMNHMFIHLVPNGAPFFLMPFMVLIETISNLIRPMTLAIRLSANMITGHLLLTLISSSSTNLNFISLNFMLLSQSILIILELSVSIIQAYVFSTLSVLYMIESN